MPVASTGNTKPRRGDPLVKDRDVLASPNSGEARAHAWAGQQQALAALGQAALTSDDVDTLLTEAVRRVADTLGLECVAAYELQSDGRILALRAGVGWREGYVGHATVGMNTESPAGFAILAGEPVVIADWRSERRFAMPALLREHDLVPGVV